MFSVHVRSPRHSVGRPTAHSGLELSRNVAPLKEAKQSSTTQSAFKTSPMSIVVTLRESKIPATKEGL